MNSEIAIKPNMLTWAIDRAGYDLEEFLLHNPVVEKWMEDLKKPTVKQLEKFAQKVHLPFGYLFLPEPPREEIPFPFFRTGRREHSQRVSLNVYDSILTLQNRQEWLSSYLRDNGTAPLEFVGRFSEDSPHLNIVADIRKVLNLAPDWARQFSTFEDSLAHLTKRIEAVGIIINFNGVVGNNTHRPVPVEECRGFVLVDPIAPFMFVNAADAKAAQLFTIVHELAHIWIGESAGFDNQNLLPANDPAEILCDQVAAEFLVPKENFLTLWNETQDFRKISRVFKVSPIVIARRALDLGKISKVQFFGFYNEYMAAFMAKKENRGSGGDFYATSRKRISPSFASYVSQAVKENRLLYRDAYKMTGLNGKTFENFVAKLY